MKNRYLYCELDHQSIYLKNIDSFQTLQTFINTKLSDRFKWLNIQRISNPESLYFYSKLNLIDQTVNCGDVVVSTNFKSILALIDEKIDAVTNTYDQIYLDEVPKFFHSDLVIDEHSTFYDLVHEKLDSLCVQAILNNLSIEDARVYLYNALKALNLPDNHLYCFQDLIRLNADGVLETILMVRIGNGIDPYHYYACYPGVGLKEIYQSDVKMLLQAGYELKEE